MIIQETAPTRFTGRITSRELTAATALMIEGETAISGGPIFCPEASGILLSLLLTAPKEPKEPR